MPTLLVVDVVATRRAVRIPVRCPNCKADLRAEHQIREWQLVDEFWYARLRRKTEIGAFVEGDEGSGTVIDYSCGSHPGNGDSFWLGPVSVFCACGYLLANGNTAVVGTNADGRGQRQRGKR